MAESNMSTQAVPAIEVRDLTVAYRERPVLWDVDVIIPQGVLAAVVGPNGAGKSTLIKSILGLVPRASGTARVLGQPIERVRRLVGYVPQRSSVDWDFPTTALDVVLMGTYGALGWLKRPGKLERQRAEEALVRVGMEAFAARQISQLSGGQQQRVFLARALAQEASLYFMDEPFAGVDATTEAAILEVLRELRSKNRTVIVVHHDLETVRERFDWVTFLNVGVIASGSTTEVFTAEALRMTYGERAAPLMAFDGLEEEANRESP